MDPSGPGPAESSSQLDMKNANGVNTPAKRRRQRVIIRFLPQSTDQAMLYTTKRPSRHAAIRDDVSARALASIRIDV
jgi:hypothetical protein